MPRFTPWDHTIDPACPNPPARHGFSTAHKEGCICSGDSYNRHLELLAKDNERRSAKRPSRAKFRTDSTCPARRHGTPHAASVGCTCRIDPHRVVRRAIPAQPVENIEDCPSRGRHGTQEACRTDGCRCPGPGFDKWLDLLRRKREGEQRRTADLKLSNQRAAAAAARVEAQAKERTAAAKHAALFPATPDTPEFDEDTRTVLTAADAACRRTPDPDIFFPIGSGPMARRQVEAAKALCRACPLLTACRRAVLERSEEHGVWAALTPEERRKIRRNRHGQVAA